MKTCDRIKADMNCNMLILGDEFLEEHVHVYFIHLLKISGECYNLMFVLLSPDEQVIFTPISDGFYTVYDMYVPLDSSKPYYFNGGKFYKADEEVNIDELININPEVSEIEVNTSAYFETCRLKKCFLNICNEILDKRTGINCEDNTVSKLLLYKRDLILIALHVIQYLVEFELYDEAERLLEKISGCNGLCKEWEGGCGCNG